MTIITSPIAPEMTRRPAGPSTLGALLAALRRLAAARRERARGRAALRRLAEAEDSVLRDIGVDRIEVLRRLRAAGGAPR